MRVRIDYSVDGVYVYNLAAWSHMSVARYGPEDRRGMLVIGLPTIQFEVKFADTTPDNPIREDIVLALIDGASPADGTYSMAEFEAEYRRMLIQSVNPPTFPII